MKEPRPATQGIPEEENMGRNNKDYSQINGLLDRGCSFEGKLAFDGTVQINGDFRGEILSDGTLVVGSEAKVDARIQVDTIIIEGHVQGLIEAKQRVELRRGAELVANINTPALVIEEGAIFQGRSQMAAGMEGEATLETTAPEGSREEGTYYEENDGEDSLMM